MMSPNGPAAGAAPTLSEPRWTHLAIPCADIERSVAFYTALTPLVVVARHSDDSGRSAWLSNAQQVATPFVLVLAQFQPESGARWGIEAGRPHRTLGPFAHIGIELPRREDVDAIAARAGEMGCLHWAPRQLAEHIGYICAATDPDGNVIEFSHAQKVYETVRTLWGTA